MKTDYPLKDVFDLEHRISQTKLRQLEASDPTRSVWVSANAGSGKTYVLVQRVLRLLLAGYNPSSLLCLTYTNAATAEMSNRVFEKLTEWSHLSDEKLAEDITKIQGEKPDKSQLSKAQNLLTKTLETPGGLKIQTIHAFCEAILQQFPLESNIAGDFSVIGDNQSKKLKDEAKKSTLASIMMGNDKELEKSFSEILEFAEILEWESGNKLEELMSDAIEHRNDINRFFSFANKNGGTEKLLRKRFGFSIDESDDKIYKDSWPLPDLKGEDLEKYISLSKEYGSTTDLKTASILEQIPKENSPTKRFKLLSNLFLTQKGSHIQKRPVTTIILKKDPCFKEKFEKSREWFDRLHTYQILKMTLASLTLADNILSNYQKLKKQFFSLDFNDLIIYTNDLLKKTEVSAWVRYKLDQEINHILLDEVQDTSLIQWDVIRSLTEDFFVGHNAHLNLRTFFAVGDEKQSIYAFQGVIPTQFSREREIYRKRITDAGEKFSAIELQSSFRSTADILTAVDKVFSIEENAQGLSADQANIVHFSNRIGHSGSVHLWDKAGPDNSPSPSEKDDWNVYFDYTPKESPSSILARRIANKISDMIGSETIISKGKKRLIRAEDILILVRKRTSFIACLTKFLENDNKIPVSGRDNFPITDHLAIKDLIALGKFMLSQEDDLSLASLLKSPIFSLSEDDIFEICAKRTKTETVYSHLTKLANDGMSKFRHIHETLRELLTLSQSYSTYDFFSLVLGSKSGRKKFISRFGNEVLDVLDEFLKFALKNEQNNSSHMQEFISELEHYPPELKRKECLNHNKVRIMTVHASKGLESPVVFLVDDGSEVSPSKNRKKMQIISSDSEEYPETPAWFLKLHKDHSLRPDHSLELVSEHIKRQMTEEKEEYHRLLYVGMTRASDKLIVCGYNSNKTKEKRTWWDMVFNAFHEDENFKEVTLKTSHNIDEWKGWEWRVTCDDNISLQEEPSSTKLHHTEELPKELFSPSKDEIEKQNILNPSTIEERKNPVLLTSRLFEKNSRDNYALKRGSLIHRLLQVVFDLPLEKRNEYVVSYCEKNMRFWSTLEREKLVSSIKILLNHPMVSLDSSFDTLAEVAIFGKINYSKREYFISGRVDRISISENNV
ncbi:double-strand break repair helicase AddA, partial [Candidatus Liberibacter sp.]|uniref:double-strand break repair helicase AddA n=1 Tax=Candidatus Liberibacter sp. TaxID=34022 RepID=UPI0015F3B3B6